MPCEHLQGNFMHPSLLSSIMLALLWLTTSAAPAWGQPDSPTPDSPAPAQASLPWHQGVSPEDKQRARELFARAADLKAQFLLADAVKTYEEALGLWEHPEIRFELATVLMKIGRYLETYAGLQRALEWGPDALNEKDRAEARTMEQTLLREHLTMVELSCQQPGVEVTLEGKRLFVGPGTWRGPILPGERVFSARRAGFYPVVRRESLQPGQRVAATMELSEDHILEKHRWQRTWVPWAVVGAGAALGVVGAGLQWQSGRDLDDWHDALDIQCGETDAFCEATDSSQLDSARWKNRVAIGALVAGSAAVITGLSLAFINRARPFRTEERDRTRFEVVPIASPDAAGISAHVSF